MIVTGERLGKELCECLHLDPKLVSAITMEFRYGEMVTVSVEMYLNDEAEGLLGRTVREFKFVATDAVDA